MILSCRTCQCSAQSTQEYNYSNTTIRLWDELLWFYMIITQLFSQYIYQDRMKYITIWSWIRQDNLKQGKYVKPRFYSVYMEWCFLLIKNKVICYDIGSSSVQMNPIRDICTLPAKHIASQLTWSFGVAQLGVNIMDEVQREGSQRLFIW